MEKCWERDGLEREMAWGGRKVGRDRYWCGVAVSGEGDGLGKEIWAVYGLGYTEGLGRVMCLGMEMGWWREKGGEEDWLGREKSLQGDVLGGTWASEGDGFGDGDGLGR